MGCLEIFPGGLGVPGKGKGFFPGVPVISGGCLFFKSCDSPDQFIHGVGREGSNLEGAVPGYMLFFCLVLLDHCMEITPPEAECTDSAYPGTPVGVEPGFGLVVEVEGGVVDIKLGIGLLGLEGGKNHLVVEAQNGFDEPCRSGRCLGVADHGFHRPQGAGVGCFRQEFLEGGEFDLVTHPGACAVGFHGAQGVRAYAGPVIGVPECPDLALGIGGVDAAGFAVAGGSHPLDHRIDSVMVLFRILQPFENQHADPLPQHGAVGIFGKGPGIAGVGEYTGLGKAHVHEDVVEGVHSAGYAHVAPAGL